MMIHGLLTRAALGDASKVNVACRNRHGERLRERERERERESEVRKPASKRD